MSNNALAAVRNAAEIDPRIRRTTHALGRALIELIRERDFGGITVQDILDRAGVGRTTFYAHYRNKEDVLHSSYDRLFEAFEVMLDRPSPAGTRLFPVTEFLQHIGEEQTLVRALQRDGQLDELWNLCAGHAARMMARRVARWPDNTAAVPGALVARMLAGALVEACKWWLDHPSATTPAKVDAAFHTFARAVLRDQRMRIEGAT